MKILGVKLSKNTFFIVNKVSVCFMGGDFVLRNTVAWDDASFNLK